MSNIPTAGLPANARGDPTRDRGNEGDQSPGLRRRHALGLWDQFSSWPSPSCSPWPPGNWLSAST